MSACHIILPTYNRRHILEKTLSSYTSLGVKLLVVDDGSTDGTEGWLRSLGIAVVRHERRRGLPAARNTGSLLLSNLAARIAHALPMPTVHVRWPLDIHTLINCTSVISVCEFS